jgi:hypothetical protein
MLKSLEMSPSSDYIYHHLVTLIFDYDESIINKISDNNGSAYL